MCSLQTRHLYFRSIEKKEVKKHFYNKNKSQSTFVKTRLCSITLCQSDTDDIVITNI